MLADGRLHVSGISVLMPFLRTENRDRLLSLAVHKTKREIEKLVAEMHPRPDVPSVIRKLPERVAAPAELPGERVPETAAPSPPPIVAGSAPRPVPAPAPTVEPLPPARYKVQFTAGEELHDDLDRLRALLRSEIPDGDLGTIVGKAVRELRRRLEARRYAQASAPRNALVRPKERRHLQFHHRLPNGLGGSHDPDNICLMCPAHNLYLAETDYGKKTISRHLNRSEGIGAAGSHDASGLFPGSVPERE